MDKDVNAQVLMQNIAMAEKLAYNASHQELLERYIALLSQMKEAIKLIGLKDSIIRELINPDYDYSFRDCALIKSFKNKSDNQSEANNG